MYQLRPQILESDLGFRNCHLLAYAFGQFTHSIYHLLNGATKPPRIVEQNELNIYKVL